MTDDIENMLDRLDQLLDMMGQELEKEQPDIDRLRRIYKLIMKDSKND